MAPLEALYISNFLITNKRLMNTLALFYDRVFLHDYFGIFICVDNPGSYRALQELSSVAHRITGEKAYRRIKNHRELQHLLEDDPFGFFIFKGVSEAFGYKTGNFNPAFLLEFITIYANFLHEYRELFFADILMFCHSSNNPHHPVNHAREIKIQPGVSIRESELSFRKAVENNKLCCLFEQEYHELPLISDSDEDLLRWDRSKDLLTLSLAMQSIHARVPTIEDIPVEIIIEARDKLKDLLIPFRQSLLKAAWEIAKAAKTSKKEEIDALATLYYETQIEPSINDVVHKISTEKGALFRKLLSHSIDKTTLIAKALDPTETFSKWDLISSGLKTALSINEANVKMAHITSPYEYLAILPDYLRVKK